MLTTLQEFIMRVESLVLIEDAGMVIEDECTDLLRAHIYTFADVDSAEPFRAAMHNLGFDTY